MSDEIAVPVSLPLDNDGFLRRECPTCEREFKWFQHNEGSGEAELVEQYFCPLCGVPAPINAWWTPEQLEYAQAVAAPEIGRRLQDSIDEAFRGIKGLSFKANDNFDLGHDAPTPITEPNDMVIVEPPCHANEPIKVPEDSLGALHCLICGGNFMA